MWSGVQLSPCSVMSVFKEFWILKYLEFQTFGWGIFNLIVTLHKFNKIILILKWRLQIRWTHNLHFSMWTWFHIVSELYFKNKYLTEYISWCLVEHYVHLIHVAHKLFLESRHAFKESWLLYNIWKCPGRENMIYEFTDDLNLGLKVQYNNALSLNL
jgi:hypothetical protein